MKGKGKGSNFERTICKQLSLWVTKAELMDCFWRSSMSGGRATVKLKRTGKRDRAQSGDIVAITPEGAPLVEIFTIECKFYAKLDWAAAVDTGIGNLSVFWKQAKKQCKGTGTSPMLIVKQNFRRVIVFFDAFGWALVRKASGDHLTRCVTIPEMGLNGVFLDQFFKHVRFNMLVTTWKEWDVDKNTSRL